jgi:uncharacterized membrane protein
VTRKVLWVLMSFLAFAVAGYTLFMMLTPRIWPPVVREHMANVPAFAIAHFIGGAIAMIVGALQLNSRLRAKKLELHRFLGKVYVMGVALGGIGGLVLAINSPSGPVAQLGFGLLAVAWVLSTAVAYRHIRGKRIEAHRAWMIRSYALTLAAVTLRIYLPFAIFSGSMEQAYVAIAWLCWVPNLIVAEFFIRNRWMSPVPHTERIARTA